MKFADILTENTPAAQALVEHINRSIPLTDSIFRMHSTSYYEVFQLARKLHEADCIDLDPVSQAVLTETDIGKYAQYQENFVPLDSPFHNDNLTEAKYQGKDVELDKPKRGGSKAYYVYVKDPKTGNVKKIGFGSGMKAKLDDPAARKAYDSRHGCSAGKHNDKTKAGYWSCRLPRYSKSLGLSGSGQWW
jgi:hypothetical protein